MKTSTSYLLGAIAFLLISAYLILSAEWAWHTVVTVVLTLTAGVIYTFYLWSQGEAQGERRLTGLGVRVRIAPPPPLGGHSDPGAGGDGGARFGVSV